MKKRFLSVAVVLAMIMTFIPTNIAFAVTGDNIVAEARNWIGTKYGHSDGSAGPGPNNYVDCCGLTMQVYRKFGIELPWYTWSQDDCGTYIPYTTGSYSNLKPGDLLFMYNSGHVGIYAGDGKVIHASSNTYGKVVEVPIWSGGRDINAVRRIITGNEPHTHSWSYGNDSSHPHREYRTCSCGEKQYTGATKLVSSCRQCYPVGGVNLTRSFNKTGKKATFYRNNVANANSYTLTLYRDGGMYNTYTMSSASFDVTNLPSGTYYANLTAKNTNTGETRSARCDSFTIVDSYAVTFDANGGTNAPSSQLKIKDEDLTLTSAVPKRAHYIFKGWAVNRQETEPQYLSRGVYTKNTKITLYAVWEPEIYTISFDVNGGKGEVQNTTITYGDTMKMPNTVVKDGYYLKGWAKTKGATAPDYKLGLEHMLDSNMTLYAVWGQSTWGGSVASKFAGGDGTEADPYQISNAAELAHLADVVNNQQSAPEYKYYKLTDNIDLGYEEWIPIGLYGNENQYFKGSFDGNGFTVSGLSITDINEGYVGLFGYAKDGEIKGLNITGNIENINSTFENAFIGTVVSYADKTDITDCSSQYVSISDITSNDNSFKIGGICGETNGKIENCEAYENYIGIQKIRDLAVGIIVGESTNTIADCTVISSEELISTFDHGLYLYVGGICGSSLGNIIVRCNVSAGSLNNNLNANGVFAGGIVGYSEGGVTIEQCSVDFHNGILKNLDSSEVNISIMAKTQRNPSSVYVGGIIGSSRLTNKYTETEASSVRNCKYNGQSLIAFSDDNMATSSARSVYSGGITGQIDNIDKCIAITDGIVYSEGAAAKDYSKAGGIAGRAKNISNAIAIADKIKSKVNSQFTNYSGDVVGYDISEGSENESAENIYTNSSMIVEAENIYDAKLTKANTIGTRRTFALIKRASFLKTVFGEPYRSLEYLKENPEAVWVIQDGEYPSLYFTMLNDITVSDVEHGALSVDKTQAVAIDTDYVTVTATPDDGYKLNKIYVNGEEITGTTFVAETDSVVYATFAEIPAEYNVSVRADANATAGLVNADKVSLSSVSLFADTTSLSATDGEEIMVNTRANNDYTVDAVFVNGEEMASDSFIVTDDSVVTMDVKSISTDIKATTGNATNIRGNGATLSGSVEGDSNSAKYIRYWRTDTPDEIYTTEVENGSGEYSVDVTDLEPYTEYEYQMTEFGDVKSFTPEYVPIDDSGTEPVEPVPNYDYPAFEIKNVEIGTAAISLDVQNNADNEATGILIIAAYGDNDSLLSVKTKTVENIATNTSKSYEITVPDAAYYRLFIWKDIKSMLPMADGVVVR